MAVGQASALNCDECMGHADVAGETETVSLHTPAWCVLDLVSLWMPPALRGENTIIPGARGRRPNPLRIDQTDHSLPFVISGVADHDGALASDRMMQLFENLRYFQAEVTDPPTAGPTRVLTLTLMDASVWVADVQFMAMLIDVHESEIITGTLELRIPNGRLEEAP